MLFNSVRFLLFFAVGGTAYFLVPKKLQWVWLLCLSLFFYASSDLRFLVFLAVNIATTFLAALLLGRIRRGRRDEGRASGHAGRFVLILALCINLGLLFTLKYFNFFAGILNALFQCFSLPAALPGFDLILPLGISFYTFQTTGYCIDVYRGKYPPEKNPAKYALFVTFFPAVMQGPIGRYDALAHQLWEPHRFDERRTVSGMQLMLWGYFKKVVVADRAAILVDQVFNHYQNYSGFEIAVASLFFTVQLYADFSGYMDIATGAAEIFGIRIAQNFNHPYFAQSIQDFWRRWHITLSSWLRDYLYIPLGGNRKGKFRKYLNIVIVFLVSGFWHGVGFHYLVWGLLHGLEQVAGAVLMPLRNAAVRLLGVRRDSFSHRLFKAAVTFSLVSLNWIFFRASGAVAALRMIRSMVTVWNPWIFFDGTLYSLGLNERNFWLSIVCFGIMLLVSLLQNRFRLREALSRQGLVFRWAVCFTGIFSVLLFGIYGIGYNAADFIYMQF